MTRPATNTTKHTKTLTMSQALDYSKQMQVAIKGTAKLTQSQSIEIRLHTQANFAEIFKSLVLMPIDNQGNTIGDIYGKAMSQWCANHALRTIAFGVTQYTEPTSSEE